MGLEDTGALQPGRVNTILDLVRGGAWTRAELVAHTGLGRKVVSTLLDTLLRSGLVSEVGKSPSTGGRPPRELAFNPHAGHLLVAEINARRLGVGICDLDGAILTSHYESADTLGDAEGELRHVERLFDRLLSHRAPDSPPIWGIGMGVLGPVDGASGRILALPIMPGWRNYPVRARFSARYNVPVWIENGVNLMAFGEHRGGIGRGSTDLVFIEMGIGIGAGVVSGSNLTQGAQGLGGEMGHLIVSDDPDPDAVCWCGNTGCLTQVAGGHAVVRRAEKALDRSPRLRESVDRNGHLTVPDITAAARAGDPLAIALVAAAGRHIGRAAASVVTITNPQVIILGGEFSEAGDALLAVVREQVNARALPLSTRRLRIELSASSDAAALSGAAFLVADQLLAPARLDGWIRSGSPAGQSGTDDDA